MLKIQDFKDQGYRVHYPRFEKDWSWKLIQKKFINGEGDTKYSIHIYLTDYRLLKYYHKMGNPKIKRHYTVKMQLYRGTTTFDITISDKWNSIEDIEVLCEEIWIMMNMDLDHHN